MITARQIIHLVMDQTFLGTDFEWDEILASVNADLLLVHRIGLDTPLEAKYDDTGKV